MSALKSIQADCYWFISMHMTLCARYGSSVLKIVAEMNNSIEESLNVLS